MSDENKLSISQIKDASRKLVSAGQDVRVRLHELTVRALTQGELAEREIRDVLGAITEGVSIGAAERAEDVRVAVSDALNGIDDALTNAADAMHHALGEASDHAKSFAEQDLKQGLDELKRLEQLFLDTVSRVSEDASGLVKQEFMALAERARSTGTGTGARVKIVTEELATRLRATAHEVGDASKRAAREIGTRVAIMASNKLVEIAAKVQKKAESLTQEK